MAERFVSHLRYSTPTTSLVNVRPTPRRDDRKAKHPTRAGLRIEGDEPGEYVGLVA
jgi:hypothetical protein